MTYTCFGAMSLLAIVSAPMLSYQITDRLPPQCPTCGRVVKKEIQTMNLALPEDLESFQSELLSGQEATLSHLRGAGPD
jgi:hypothetical protein